MVSDPYSCEDNLMRIILNFTDPAEPRLSRNLTIDFSSQENESGEVLYWISGISAYLQTEFSNNEENDATVLLPCSKEFRNLVASLFSGR